MPIHADPDPCCPECQQRRYFLREQDQLQHRFSNEINIEPLNDPPSLNSSQSRETHRINHGKGRPVDTPAGPIQPTIDPRRWETIRPSEIGRDPHGPPVPLPLDQDEEDSREARELWRELDLVHGMGIAFAGPGAPQFDRRAQGASFTASNPPGMYDAVGE